MKANASSGAVVGSIIGGMIGGAIQAFSGGCVFGVVYALVHSEPFSLMNATIFGWGMFTGLIIMAIRFAMAKGGAP